MTRTRMHKCIIIEKIRNILEIHKDAFPSAVVFGVEREYGFSSSIQKGSFGNDSFVNMDSLMTYFLAG
jgi:hypothetical protein